MSYETLVDGYRTREEMVAHEKQWGGYNDPLPHMKEITAEEFAQSGFFTWCITGIEFRQVDPKRIKEGSLLTPTKEFMSLRVFFTNGPKESGFAMTNDYWGGKIRYFKFAECYHEYRELSQEETSRKGIYHGGNNWHVCECKNCGHIWAYDSSG